MNFVRKMLRNWLGFSRTEVNGFFILLPLMGLVIASEPVYRWYVSRLPPQLEVQDHRILDSLIAHWAAQTKSVKTVAEHDAPGSREMFPFDPNKVSPDSLRKLGFSERLTTRIAGYRQKGGVFRIKPDLLKIYGMDSTFYHQLYPYIALPEKREYAVFAKRRPAENVSKRGRERFDLNTADTVALKSVFGIGPALAARIVRFRDALGGFTRMEQLGEVYGLDTAVVSRLAKATFIADDFEPRKLNLNSNDEKMLESHPYVTRAMARAIVSYRYQHGKFSSEEDILKISIITPRDAERLVPYLSVQE